MSTAAPTAPLRAGSPALRIRAIVRRHAYVQKRAPQRWFDVMVWPMVDTVIWGSIGKFVDQQGGAVRSGAPYMLSGILLMHVVYQSNVSLSTGFMEETWSRNLLNFMVTPLREAEYLAGVILFGLARLAMGLTFVGIAAWLLYAFNVTHAGWGLVPVVGVLMLVGWAISLLVIGLILRYGSGAEILTWGILFRRVLHDEGAPRRSPARVAGAPVCARVRRRPGTPRRASHAVGPARRRPPRAGRLRPPLPRLPAPHAPGLQDPRLHHPLQLTPRGTGVTGRARRGWRRSRRRPAWVRRSGRWRRRGPSARGRSARTRPSTPPEHPAS